MYILTKTVDYNPITLCVNNPEIHNPVYLTSNTTNSIISLIKRPLISNFKM